MARATSQSPKERINVTYKTVIDGVEQQVELPLKILMIGDYSGRPDDTPLEERETIKVDKDNFNDVMASQGLALELDVPDKLTEGSEDDLGVKLEFRGLDDFTPDGVARQVPELHELLSLRDSLRKAVRPMIANNRGDLRKRLQAMVNDASKRSELREHFGIDESAS